MFHVVEGAAGLTAAEALIATRTEQLDKLISVNRRKHLNVRVAVRCSESHEEIVGHAEEVQVQAQLIVLIARGHASDCGSTAYRGIQLEPGLILAIHA